MKFEFYRDASRKNVFSIREVREYLETGDIGDWRWRLKSSGRIVADSGEGYKRIDAMLRTLRSIFKNSPIRLQEIDRAERVARK